MSVSVYRNPMYVICIAVAQVNVFLNFTVSVVVPEVVISTRHQRE